MCIAWAPVALPAYKLYNINININDTNTILTLMLTITIRTTTLPHYKLYQATNYGIRILKKPLVRQYSPHTVTGLPLNLLVLVYPQTIKNPQHK